VVVEPAWAAADLEVVVVVEVVVAVAVDADDGPALADFRTQCQTKERMHSTFTGYTHEGRRPAGGDDES
jgi:hypothetical protein